MWTARSGLVLFAAALGLPSPCSDQPEQRLASQAETDQQYLIDRLAAVCDGKVHPQTAAYEESPGEHPTVIVQSFEGGEGDWYRVESPFEPKTLEETQLVACAWAGGRPKVSVFRSKDGVEIGTFELTRQGGGDSAKNAQLVQAVKPFAEGTPPASAKLAPAEVPADAEVDR